ncbi:CAF1-domain-containing protein [Imleria badia]|nr:CAF1-domain-containing protein [Imleria badia]
MSRIREVWGPNLEAEMRNIREMIDLYSYVAMDTEFPGVVARPIGTFKTSSDYHYQTMRCNVDLLKLIQIGITLADEEGNFPQDVTTWQFNFKFSIGEDMYAPESIELLQKSGIDFQRHEEMGISPNDFAELFITSGLVLVPEAKWISFHSERFLSSLISFSSDSGYDFGYLVKLLTAMSLPTSEDIFFESLRTWFPHCYDIKFMMRACKSLKGGLQDVADDLGVRPSFPLPAPLERQTDLFEKQVMRIGTSHQAGSDSLLTASTFFKMRELYFGDDVDDVEYNGKLYGLGQTFSVPNGFTDNVRGGATIAERDDRNVARDAQNATPGIGASNGQQTQNSVMGIGVPMQTPSLGGALPPSGTTYAPLGGSNPYMRTAIGVGGR